MSVARRRFRFIKEIAEGGFGKVYLAEQLSADGFSRIVAVKLLHAKWSSHSEVVMRTRDEARLLGLIRHQHIVKVEDLSSIDGKCAIVMEYLEGVDLKGMAAHLTERGMDFPRAALFEIMLSVASALDAAYNSRPLQGGEPLRVLHRDIKPSNVFLTVNGQIKLLDFGTARANFAQREAKTQALAFGSQGYMAPERMLGEEDTAAADVFSLGVTLYELLTLESFGRIPPRPNKFLSKVEERVNGVPLGGDPEWADQVRETLRLMLSYEPTDRPTAHQLIEIFEILSQNSDDMGLRRFCRTLVAEAKATEPELDTGDPLIGALVDEDESSVFDRGASGALQPGDMADDLGTLPPPPPGGLLGAAPPSLPPQLETSSGAAGLTLPPDSFDGPELAQLKAVMDDEPEPKKKGGGLKMVIIALVVLVVLGGGLVVLVGGGTAAALFFNGGTSGLSPDVPDVPEPVVEEPAFTGHVVSTEDSRADVERTPTTLQVSDPAGVALVKVSGLGFSYALKWDGQGTLDLGELGEGTYRTVIEPRDGDNQRGSFAVEDASSCSFTFDVAAGEWTGGC